MRAVAYAEVWPKVLRPYIVSFKYKSPGDKQPGPVRQFRVYANSLAEARRLVAQQANYANLEILGIRPA